MIDGDLDSGVCKKVDGKWSDSEYILKVDRPEALLLVGMWGYVDMEEGR